MSRRIPTITLPLLLLAVAACQDEPLRPEPAPAEVRVTPDSVAIPLGETATLAAEVRDAQGEPVRGAHVRFTSSHPDIAAVDSLTGVITGVAPGTAEIMVSAPPLQIPVWVIVHSARFGWAWSSSAGPHVAGGRVEYTFVILEKAARVPGVPVVFSWEGRAPAAWGTDSVLTDVRGIARVSLPLPTNPVRARFSEFYYSFERTFEFPPFRVRMTALLPDGSTVEDSSTLEVLPDAPDHIEVLAFRRGFDQIWLSIVDYNQWQRSSYRVLEGGEVVLRKYSVATTTVDGARKEYHGFVDSLAVIVADRFGNATDVLATVVADGLTLQSETHVFVDSSTRYYCLHSVCRRLQSDELRRIGSVLVTNLAAPVAPVRLTINAAGLAPQTVTVVGVDSIP